MAFRPCERELRAGIVNAEQTLRQPEMQLSCHAFIANRYHVSTSHVDPGL